jgi:peptidyl-prolyl cis-trans isomerase SurA
VGKTDRSGILKNSIQCVTKGLKLKGYFFNKVNTANIIYTWFVGIIFIVTPVRAELVDRIVAVVNNDIILMSDVKQAASLSKSPVVTLEEQKALLDQLIDKKLTMQQVASLGIRVSEEEINATIKRIKEVNKLSDEAFLRMLELDGKTYEAFKKEMQNQLLQNRLVVREVKSKIVITDKDVKEYYDAHKELYAGKVKYHLRHILIKVDSNRSGNEKEEKYQQITDVSNRLKRGGNFADLAREFSQAPTAAQGGDLGFFELRLLTPQIRSALKGLEAGQYSDIIEADQGYQLFFVEEKQTAGGQYLEEAAAAIEEKLYSRRMEEKFQIWLADLRNKAHIRIIEK